MHRQDNGVEVLVQGIEHGTRLVVVDRGYRLVTEYERTTLVNRAAHTDALLLTTGQRAGRFEQLVREAQPIDDGPHRRNLKAARPDEIE